MWSAPVTIAQPAGEPVSLDEAKEFLGVDPVEGEFDGLLSGLIVVARDQVEAVTGTRLVEQTVQLGASAFCDLLHLPIGPVQSVSAIVYDDLDGVEQTIAAEDYELFGAGLSRGIRLAVGAEWPNAVRCGHDTIRVNLVVGYETMPRPLWAAMLLMVGDLFANRETVAVGASASQIPMALTVEVMLTNYRIWL